MTQWNLRPEASRFYSVVVITRDSDAAVQFLETQVRALVAPSRVYLFGGRALLDQTAIQPCFQSG